MFFYYFFLKKIFYPKTKKGFFNKAKKMIHENFWIYIIAGLVTAVDRPRQQPARSENKSTPILFMGSLRSPQGQKGYASRFALGWMGF